MPNVQPSSIAQKLPPILWPHMLSDAELAKPGPRRWIQVAKTGDFFSHKYGKFSITQDDLQQMLTNFLSVTPIAPTELPVDYDHLSMDPKAPGDGKAAGWFVTGSMELRREGKELWAEVEFTEDGLSAIQKKEYRFISPSFIKDYVWKNGKNIGTTLVAAAITNHPFLEGMAAITMSMDLGDLAGIPAPPVDTPTPVATTSTTNLAAVGQRVVLQPTIIPPGTDPAAVYEVLEVAGVGDDEFVKLKNAAGATAWYRVSDLLPAPAAPAAAVPVTPVVAQPQPGVPVPAPANMRSQAMADVYKLRDARGNEVEVKAADLSTWMADQLNAAKTVPEGSVVISASKLAEFEQSASVVTSLSQRVEAAEKSAHLVSLTARLDVLSKAGRITKVQRDYAMKKFGEPTQLADFTEWEATVPAGSIVPLDEVGSGAAPDATGGSKTPDGELRSLALARSKEKGISLTDAIGEVAQERQDLSLGYRRQVNEKAGRGERIIH